jgi:hypothetical protein
MVFAWLRGIFALPSPEAEEPEVSKRRGKSQRRSHSKKVRDRERELRRQWTGQKGDSRGITSKGGSVGGAVAGGSGC